MPDVSHITVSGTTYDIADPTVKTSAISLPGIEYTGTNSTTYVYSYFFQGNNEIIVVISTQSMNAFKVYTTTDMVNFTQKGSLPSGTTTTYLNIVYNSGDSKYYLISNGNTKAVYHTTNLSSSWTAITLTYAFTDGSLLACADGYVYCNATYIYRIKNGAATSTGSSYKLTQVAYINSKWSGVLNSGSYYYIGYSTNGSNWTIANSSWYVEQQVMYLGNDGTYTYYMPMGQVSPAIWRHTPGTTTFTSLNMYHYYSFTPSNPYPISSGICPYTTGKGIVSCSSSTMASLNILDFSKRLYIASIPILNYTGFRIIGKLGDHLWFNNYGSTGGGFGYINLSTGQSYYGATPSSLT